MNRFVSDSLQTFTLSILNRVLGIAVGITLARYLGPAGKGLVAYAGIALELFITATSGIAQALTFQYGRNKVPGAQVYGAMMRIIAAVAIPATVVLAVVGALVPSQAPLIAVAVAVPFAMYGQATNGILLAADRVSATNVKALITGSVLNAVLIALLVLLHVDAWIVIWAWVASYVAAAGYTWFALRPFVREGGPPPGEIIREQAIFGLKAGGGQVAAYINLRIDVILVSAVLGARALGLYTLAVTVSELLWQLSQPVCWSAFGRIATAPRDESAAFAAKLVRHIVAIVLPVAAVLFIVGPVAIAIVYGAPFADSGGALRWILPGVAAYAAEIPIGYYLLVKEARPVLVVGCQTVSLLACAALTLITLPRWGIDGAAFATSATYIGVVVVQAAVFIRTTGIPVRDLLILRRDDFGRLSGLFARMRARAGALVAR